ncbi:hypothetical protein [Tolypothrix sp. PCC 7910]|uniref:hypothetical protein n=1 Tax=Tolypothrix sp. PCC 7910 TaxID=2099387 RepID=UPI001FCBDC91|nr:hypothetical protein [Tolypothrix sp. PCC 7910]
MSEANSSMVTPVTDTFPDLATALLTHYSFDLSGYSASELIRRWKTHYPLEWLHIAVIEALYQGRYKAVSVQQILNFWHRRGQATYHFNMEFERLICSKFPESLTAIPSPVLYPAKKNPSVEKTSYHLSSPTGDASATKVNHEYHQRQLAPIKVVPEPEKTEETAPVVPQLQPTLQPEYAVAQTGNNSPRFLPAAANHSPIGQFTPEISDRTDSFTSKLKAMSGRQIPRRSFSRDHFLDENSVIS